MRIGIHWKVLLCALALQAPAADAQIRIERIPDETVIELEELMQELEARDRGEETASAAPPLDGPDHAALARETWRELWQRFRERLDRYVEISGTRAAALGGALVVLSGLLLASLLRGRGDLGVFLDYPPALRGTFNVRVARRRRASRRAPPVSSAAEAARLKRSARASTSTLHTLVSRETHFRGLRARRYFARVEGFLQGAEGEDVVHTHFEEREVQVRRGETVRVEFDVHPRGARIDVKVAWDRRPVSDARVALRGEPGSLRFTRSGTVRVGVSPGRHVLVVGSGDRVAEVPVEVTGVQPCPVQVDLAARETLLFNGCPPAVEPYLHGDVPGAARALERDGQTELSHLLLARQAEARGQRESAAHHFEAAGRLPEAAALREALGQFDQAAALFERLEDHARAGEMYLSAGNPRLAGDSFARAGDHARAAEAFREAGETGRLIDALERTGRAYEAAELALGSGDIARAIRSFQQVVPEDAHYRRTADKLAEIYGREGHLDLAAFKLEEILRLDGEDDVPLEVCDRLAQVLDQLGNAERALDVLELMRRRDATYPNVATRLELLRKRLSRERVLVSGGSLEDSGETTAPVAGPSRRYEILEEIGRGGMGVVVRARDRRLGRVVALKRLPDNLKSHPRAVELFLREARAAAALNHPNIVTVHDAGQEGDLFYITMELLEGSPLHHILHKRKRLSGRDVARLGLQVARGLQYAHDQRIVHRDIKTANLFVTRDRVVKIMDFGLAKMLEEVRRASTIVGGTPFYMAPEQGLGEAVDHRVDLYALGITFFELLTGAVPFADGDVAYRHRHEPAPDPRERADHVPEAFAALVLALLAKRPEDRPASAAAVAEALQPLANG